MVLKQLVQILSEDHAGRNDHDIFLMLHLDIIHVLIESIDVGVVNSVQLLLCREEKLDSAALGVDVVVTACADVGCQ